MHRYLIMISSTPSSSRLRPRKAKASEPDPTAARGSGIEKRARDPSPPDKGTPPEIGKHELAMTKRGCAKRLRPDSKESAARDAVECVAAPPNADEKGRGGSKKGRKSNGDPQQVLLFFVSFHIPPVTGFLSAIWLTQVALKHIVPCCVCLCLCVPTTNFIQMMALAESSQVVVGVAH